MAICPICKIETDDRTIPSVITTANLSQARMKIGFKQYQYLSQLNEIEKHSFNVCNGCEKKYSRTLPFISWSIGFVLFVLLAIFAEHESKLLLILFAGLVLFSVIYFLNSAIFCLDSRLKRLAIIERRKEEKHQPYVAYNASEYARFEKESKRNRF